MKNKKENLLENIASDKAGEDKKENIEKRPWIITFFCIIGIFWLILYFLGLLSFIVTKNFRETGNAFDLFIELITFFYAIIALRLYWQMKKAGVYILGIISSIEIILNLLNGVWPLSLSCGCQFPILLTILGLIYRKRMS
jgi:tryptophan-rich sensory protein